jgi:O-antigen/teichoic acid export membrane protein
VNRNAARDALLVFVGRVLFVALWYVALLLVYKGLGQDEEGLAQAGLFAVAIACVKIISGCLIEPVDIALMRRGPALLRDDPDAAFRLFRAAFWMRLGAVLAAGAVALAALGVLGPDFPGGPGLAALMPYILVTVAGEMLFRSVLVVLQAAERFITYVLVEGVLQTARFAAILALWALGGMELHNVVAGYAAAPYVAALCGALLVPRALLASGAADRDAFADLFHFLKWMTPAMVLAAVNERLDVLMVYSFDGADAAGLYGAMITLAVAPDLLAGSLGSILQPRIVAMQAAGGYAAALRRYLLVALPACGAALGVAMLISEPVLLRLLGPTYAAGVPAFLWLLAGTLFWLAVTPMPMSLVAILAPRRVALVTMGQSAIVVGVGLLLLPAFGVVGMAQAVCAMRVAIALVLLALAHRIDRRPTPRQGLSPAAGAGAS